MPRIFTTALLAVLAAASPAAAAPRDNPDVQLQKLLAGRVAGKPVDCISLSGQTSSRIIEGKAIVYEVGRRLYVNQPSSGARWLDDDSILVTRLYGSQLCSVDTVHLVDRTSHFPRGFVMLGKFVPYTKVKQAS